MTNGSVTPSSAAEWFLTIHATEEPSPELLQKWLRWLEESEQNRQAFEDIARVWHGTPSAVIARRASEHSEEQYDGAVSVAQWHANPNRARGKAGRIMRSSRRIIFATAAAVGVLAAGLWAHEAFDSKPLSNGKFATRVGEYLPLVLADGSKVVLGAQSRLVVDFNSGARKLRLEAGEAFFSVRKDPLRPFTVSALNGTITAVGTAFNVRNIEDRVTVTVAEGAVRVAESTISRGQQLTYQQDAGQSVIEIEAPKKVDASESARWRDGWLVYRDELLSYVVADISRYADIDVTVAGPAESLQFSGAVSKDRIEEWLAALPEVAPVVVEARGRRFIIRSK